MVERDEFNYIEERLKVIEGGENYAFANMAKLCRVPDMVIPPKLKVSDFDKYKGTTCPKNHLKMYGKKMGAYVKNEKLLMHFFHENLTGAAVTWYTNLEASRVHSWKDLMVAFIRQYQYNSDMAPDRMQLQNMCKKEHEYFKEYAQRWRDLAAQVAPPMTEKEMITMIVDILPGFYNEMIVDILLGFYYEMIVDIFDHPALMNKKPGENREKEENEGGTHVVIAIPTWPNFPPAQQYQYSANINPSHYPPPYQPKTLNHRPQRPPLNQPQSLLAAHPIPNTTLNTNENTNQGRNFPAKKHVEFTLIPVSYADLLPYLLRNAMVAITRAKVPQPPFSRGYNSNATCAYHGGVLGHSIDHRMTLKHKVQGLVDVGWLKFEEDNHL